MNLQEGITQLARIFAESLITTIRGMSIEELVDLGAGGVSQKRILENGLGVRVKTPAPKATSPSTSRELPSGRLKRRSAEDIAAEMTRIVEFVSKHPDGARAEAIREALGYQPKEMPRILQEAIAQKRLATKGQKRATTYFAIGSSARATPKPSASKTTRKAARASTKRPSKKASTRKAPKKSSKKK